MRYESACDSPPIAGTRRPFSFSTFDLDAHVGDARRSLDRADASRMRARVLDLKDRKANWDGRGSAAANRAAIDRAVAVLDTHALQARGARLHWWDPHVSLDEDGNVVFEWWNAERKLTLYVSPNVTEFVSSWGPDIDNNMDAGALSGGQLLGLWQWLTAPLDNG
jgi:hypothetical protein